MDPVKDEPFSRRPDNSAFKQQRLPAWTPMLTAHSVLPFLYFTGLICLLLGIWLILTVQTIQEMKASAFPGSFSFFFPPKSTVKYFIFLNSLVITVSRECV